MYSKYENGYRFVFYIRKIYLLREKKKHVKNAVRIFYIHLRNFVLLKRTSNVIKSENSIFAGKSVLLELRRTIA